MAIDWDDLLSYTTTRSVTVRHRYLGLTYYSLLTGVLVYIFVGQIGFQKKYNVQLDVDGSIQANVQGPAALRPLSELDYCNRTYVDGHVYECVYPELATGVLAKAVIGVEGSLLIGTRLSSTVQHRDASCGQHDAYHCPAWLPEYGTAAYDEAKTTAFVGDVDRSTIRFQHKVARDTEAAFGLKVDDHFLTSFSPVAERVAAAPRMCLERDHSVCVAPQMLATGDVFNLSQLVTLAGKHLDANLTGGTPRYTGLTLKVRVAYSEPQHYDYFLSNNDLMTKEVFVAPEGFGTEPTKPGTRTLLELHGVQIILSHGGRLGKFSLSQLLLALVTGFGLLAVAKVATDTILMYAMPKREAYRLFVRDLTPDFAPSTDEQRAVLAQVLRAKRGERSFLQGGQLSDEPGAPMLLSPVAGGGVVGMHGGALTEPLSAATPTMQSAASGDV